MTSALAYHGLDALERDRQLRLVDTNSTELIKQISGCLVVYKVCRVVVLGSDI